MRVLGGLGLERKRGVTPQTRYKSQVARLSWTAQVLDLLVFKRHVRYVSPTRVYGKNAFYLLGPG